MTDPPDGACRVHADLPAVARCPSCGAPSCPLCWHAAPQRCTGCLAREPGGDTPEVPWETSAGSALGRFARTLLGTFAPARTAAAFGRPRPLGAAIRFALLSALPFVLVVSAVEYTFTFELAGAGAFRWVGQPSTREVVLDVARACGLGVVVTAIKLLAFAVPFVSLCRAYGLPGRGAGAATRAMLYRVWVVPAFAAFALFVVWPLPERAAELGAFVLEGATVLPLLLLAMTMRGVARDAAGVGPWVSWVVVLVALAVGMTVAALTDRVVAPLVPSSVAPQRAERANGSPA